MAIKGTFLDYYNKKMQLEKQAFESEEKYYDQQLQDRLAQIKGIADIARIATNIAGAATDAASAEEAHKEAIDELNITEVEEVYEKGPLEGKVKPFGETQYYYEHGGEIAKLTKADIKALHTEVKFGEGNMNELVFNIKDGEILGAKDFYANKFNTTTVEGIKQKKRVYESIMDKEKYAGAKSFNLEDSLQDSYLKLSDEFDAISETLEGVDYSQKHKLGFDDPNKLRTLYDDTIGEQFNTIDEELRIKHSTTIKELEEKILGEDKELSKEAQDKLDKLRDDLFEERLKGKQEENQIIDRLTYYKEVQDFGMGEEFDRFKTKVPGADGKLEDAKYYAGPDGKLGTEDDTAFDALSYLADMPSEKLDEFKQYQATGIFDQARKEQERGYDVARPSVPVETPDDYITDEDILEMESIGQDTAFSVPNLPLSQGSQALLPGGQPGGSMTEISIDDPWDMPVDSQTPATLEEFEKLRSNITFDETAWDAMSRDEKELHLKEGMSFVPEDVRSSFFLQRRVEDLGGPTGHLRHMDAVDSAADSFGSDIIKDVLGAEEVYQGWAQSLGYEKGPALTPFYDAKYGRTTDWEHLGTEVTGDMSAGWASDYTEPTDAEYAAYESKKKILSEGPLDMLPANRFIDIEGYDTSSFKPVPSQSEDIPDMTQKRNWGPDDWDNYFNHPASTTDPTLGDVTASRIKGYTGPIPSDLYNSSEYSNTVNLNDLSNPEYHKKLNIDVNSGFDSYEKARILNSINQKESLFPENSLVVPELKTPSLDVQWRQDNVPLNSTEKKGFLYYKNIYGEEEANRILGRY